MLVGKFLFSLNNFSSSLENASLACSYIYPNFWFICWKNVVMLLSSRMSGGAEVELPRPERAGADKSNSLRFWKPPK